LGFTINYFEKIKSFIKEKIMRLNTLYKLVKLKKKSINVINAI